MSSPPATSPVPPALLLATPVVGLVIIEFASKIYSCSTNRRIRRIDSDDREHRHNCPLRFATWIFVSLILILDVASSVLGLAGTRQNLVKLNPAKDVCFALVHQVGVAVLYILSITVKLNSVAVWVHSGLLAAYLLATTITAIITPFMPSLWPILAPHLEWGFSVLTGPALLYMFYTILKAHLSRTTKSITANSVTSEEEEKETSQKTPHSLYYWRLNKANFKPMTHPSTHLFCLLVGTQLSWFLSATFELCVFLGHPSVLEAHGIPVPFAMTGEKVGFECLQMLFAGLSAVFVSYALQGKHLVQYDCNMFSVP